MSSVTEDLSRLLDERGVKWTSERVSDGVLFTFAKDSRTYSVFARDRAGLEIWSKYLTPEQVIAATLGPREQPPHDQLQADNEKLRQLVRHMYECMGNIDADGNHECDSCEYDNEDGKCDYGRQMRELGIEVDE